MAEVNMPPDMVDRRPYQNILYEKDPGDPRIVRIMLNRPESMNALSYDMLMDLKHALVYAERDMDVKVIIVKGAGRSFGGGYDLGARPHYTEGVDRITAKEDHIKYYHLDTWYTVWNLRKPVIAQVHGYALAGSGELAMMCDLTIVADDAVIGVPPVRGQSVMDTEYWPFMCGLKKAKYLTLVADPITGKEAAQIDLATMSVPLDQLEETTTLVAKRLAMVPSELLFLNKFACNKCFEIMGMRVAQEIVGKLHDYSSTFPPVEGGMGMFGKISREKGLNAALAWRDYKFGNDYRALKGLATEKGTDYSFPQAYSMPEMREFIKKGIESYEKGEAPYYNAPGKMPG